MEKAKIFKYRRVYEALTARIEAGFYHGALPSEEELGREYQAGRNIVRQAMEMLAADGYIVKERGRCARVNPGRIGGKCGHRLVLLQRFNYLRDDDNPIYDSIIIGLLEEAVRRGVKLENLYLPPDSAPEYVRHVAETLRCADGIFSTYMPELTTAPEVAAILRRHPRLIGLDYVLGAFGRYFVGTDNYAGGRMAAELLARAWRKHPLLLGIAPAFYRYSPMIERVLGFRDGCELDQMAFDHQQALIREIHPESSVLHEILIEALARFPETDAIFCITDKIAYLVCRELAGLGYRVPEDIAVIGFDGVVRGREEIELTSIRQPVEAITVQSFNLMETLLRGNETVTGKFIPVPPTLKAGRTL